MEEAKKRILVIDDDPAIHAALEITFTGAGFEYARAQTAEEGLCALGSSVFDIVIVDGLLPDMSGMALCKRIRSLPRHAGLCVIFYSAFFKKAEFFKKLKSEINVDLVLHKPVEPSELLRRAVELLGLRAAALAQPEEDPFAELKLEFNDTFFNRLQAIESLLEKLASGAPQEAPLKGLLFITHKLHGTSAIFGHPLVGETAAIWEEELDKIIESSKPVTSRELGKFRFYFDWLKLNFQTPAQSKSQEIEFQRIEEEESRRFAGQTDTAPVSDAAVVFAEPATAAPEVQPEETEAASAAAQLADEDAAPGPAETAPESFKEPEPQPEPASGDAPAPEPEALTVAEAHQERNFSRTRAPLLDESLLSIGSDEEHERHDDGARDALLDEDLVKAIKENTPPAIKQPDVSQSPDMAEEPALQESAQTPAAGAAEESGGPDILIVDDDPVVQRLVSYALGLRGYKYETIGDGDSARERLFGEGRGPLPGLVLLDVDLPGTDGFTLLREIMETPGTSAIKVMMVSAHGREEDLLRGFESGAADFIIKPFSVPILAHKIRIALTSSCSIGGAAGP